jgi:ATP-dependent RNA helicase DDX6/DHH1
VIARAKNGTGKTGAYVIPILEKIDTTKDHIQAVILVPTRELALQTSAVLKELGKFIKVESMVSTGGTSVREDIYRLYKPVHVIVCTPGRILDLASKQVADLSKCEIMVMDEADKLLSVDFQPIIEKLVEMLPANRQILMLSATFPLEVEKFKKKYLSAAKEINLMEELTLKGLTQYYAYVEEKQKVHCLNTLFTKVPQTVLLLAPNKPGHHLLQLHIPGQVPGEEDL